MKHIGIIITGTRGSGKSAIAKNLCAKSERFARVEAVTTRGSRADDEAGVYRYVSEDEFSAMRDSGRLLVHTSYRDKHYGIARDALVEVERHERIPVMVLTPESAAELAKTCLRANEDTYDPVRSYMTVFVDAPDEVLNERLKARGDPQDDAVTEQRRKDREAKNAFYYVVQNSDLHSTTLLVSSLWEALGTGGVLPGPLIGLMLKCGMLLERANADQVSGASYDLSLGDEFFYGGRIRRLSKSDPILFIEPYDYAIVTSNERASFPVDVCGRFDLAVNLFCQGIILSNGPQVDPGFHGPLFCLLFNTSSSPVLLKRRQHYATLEFHRLTQPTFRYRGEYEGKELLDYLPPNAARGAINELKKELECLRVESRRLHGLAYAILTVLMAVIAILIALK